jgi:hypothetical protein
MQARGGVGTTIPRRGGRRLEALLTVAAILVIVAVMALMTRGMVAPASSGVGAQDAKAGAAVVHDDAGNMPATGAGAAVVHDDAANMPPGAGAAIVHDDAGSVR